jgi:hypothetical protein
MRHVGASLRRIGRWVRRRPILATFLFVLVFVMGVPVWPYKPRCGIYSSATFGTLDGEMTPDFLEAIDRSGKTTSVICGSGTGSTFVYSWRSSPPAISIFMATSSTRSSMPSQGWCRLGTWTA